MPNAALEEVQPGWKVFAGPDEVGKVAEAREHELDVRRGTIFQHTYRVPDEYIAEADEGVVDLAIDRETFEELEVKD